MTSTVRSSDATPLVEIFTGNRSGGQKCYLFCDGSASFSLILFDIEY